MTENEPIKTVSDGITFLSTGKYYDGINQWVAHKLKEGDHDAMDYAARQIAKLLPQNAVLVPIPGHHGKAEQTMQLARAISSLVLNLGHSPLYWHFYKCLYIEMLKILLVY